jgi:sugar diacid utilization regulator
VRALSYRLQRVHELTGYRAADPAHQLPLLVAVTGARLLDWPARPAPR